MLAKKLRAATGATAALTAGFLIAACGSSSMASGQKFMTMSNGQTMRVSSMTTTSTKTEAASGSMDMSSGSMHVDTKVPEVNGQHPVASQALATSYWQGMEIQARTTTPVRFVVYNGVKETMMRPAENSSFHLMVMLMDKYTKEPIPYSTVWATIRTPAGKVVYDQRQWPMISAFMGPHYGSNVPHLKPGHYKLTLLISPPVAARHIEYAHVWLHTHRVTDAFTWNPKTSKS